MHIERTRACFANDFEAFAGVEVVDCAHYTFALADIKIISKFTRNGFDGWCGCGSEGGLGGGIRGGSKGGRGGGCRSSH